jgi:chemotaxis protein methyltransferase CheR
MQVEQEDISRVIYAIKSNSVYDFSNYSIKSFTRRIEKTLFDFKLDITGLIKNIKSSSQFIDELVKNITVNTTELFRDPKAWQSLRYRILNQFTDNRKINIWHAGCSTGPEVYSMLILLSELGLLERANVFATDINEDVISIAKLGEYTYRFNLEYFENFNKVICENPFNYEVKNNIPYSKYFEIDKKNDLIRVHDFLRKKPVWIKHDLVTEGNIFNTKFDLILCRNVLIYFNTDLQSKVFETFYHSLFRNGVMMIGIHESIIGPLANSFIKSGLLYIRKD